MDGRFLYRQIAQSMTFICTHKTIITRIVCCWWLMLFVGCTQTTIQLQTNNLYNQSMKLYIKSKWFFCVKHALWIIFQLGFQILYQMWLPKVCILSVKVHFKRLRKRNIFHPMPCLNKFECTCVFPASKQGCLYFTFW